MKLGVSYPPTQAASVPGPCAPCCSSLAQCSARWGTPACAADEAHIQNLHNSQQSIKGHICRMHAAGTSSRKNQYWLLGTTTPMNTPHTQSKAKKKKEKRPPQAQKAATKKHLPADAAEKQAGQDARSWHQQQEEPVQAIGCHHSDEHVAHSKLPLM